MDKKNNKKAEFPPLKDRPKMGDAAPAGVNVPDVSIPLFNPPVPNRAWTAMKAGMDIEELTEEERRDLYLGHDNLS